jgi:hypothetical protein
MIYPSSPAPPELVVIASASRSGSTFLTTLLSRVTRLLHLPGEPTPFFPRSLVWPAREDDALTADDFRRLPPADRLAWATSIRQAAGWPGSWERMERQAFARQLHHRLARQWPQEAFSRAAVHRAMEAALAPAPGDAEAFWLGFLEDLRDAHPNVDPFLYDLPAGAVRARFPDVPEGRGPAHERVVEEPPFHIAEPWRVATDDEFRALPLLIKSPSLSYRLAFLQEAFPSARLRVIHLTRDARPAVRGLRAGWRHNGFHSHRVGGLSIDGYADAHWWKFDLPPGWQAYRGRPLEDVCAHQWYSAHAAILRYLDAHRVDSIRMRYEDLLDLPSRGAAMGRLGRWLFGDESLDALAGAPVRRMMASGPDRRGADARAGERLDAALADPRIAAMRAALGYGA